ncbi:thiamine pyrophosphate-binding protein [Anabaena cylindrica FACHB-243]|uniref:Acetolactate synthase n=1 Tax=Anabaena cylindrica (strain ATCC 27899 / PCC 7122) TaxID=272123 RepID=K9ZC70_ANACC|nr:MULTISPECIES: ScyA-related TPP-binding enzyme [Anabaena]AFZ56818.1 Acetolactate synthase [Anabaena cylindrica PCC 7122]MBD2418972.1 thiamine pyrophosphate-binding protein [Anabaena cylindrica FACHB-243]MBY5285114.1 thiamine pyrophosphate-binding protein [Anabaena sp. CCAP 1446/1C]MBY5308846.1 thiamine pyrophosphate-binding protein [Anabaena sp. CCAP 1446/1C]MCM2409495.1 ScyA-related TPP-binding enzyme [Anabaena sp. CCAP 1446/1C]
MLAIPETTFAAFPSALVADKSSIADIPSRLALDKFSPHQDAAPVSVASAIVKMLENLGVEYAFGVSGGAIAPIWYTLQHSAIQLRHFRHEAGAAFAATEAYFTSGRPVVVFTTTGPGITNALTGLLTARWEDAKVIFISASTSAPKRGRWALQETSNYTMPSSGIVTSEPIFHYATTLESNEELPEVYRRLAKGLAKPNGFVAHLSVPTNIQADVVKTSLTPVNLTSTPPTASAEVISQCAELLSADKFAIWVGFGARFAATEIRQLAERTGAAVMCSPRAKGIFPEDHPQFVGVTGFAGHESVLKYLQESRPVRTLVLGTRLGEFTSFWNPAMVPPRGFVHVDIDPEVPGTAYPSAETIAIQSEVGIFVKALLKHFPKQETSSKIPPLPRPERTLINPSQDNCLVQPEVLMNVLQRVIVEGSNAIVMAEGGNSFAWAINLLRFIKPGRFRVSTGFGAMGHFVTSVVGAALTHTGKAVAIVGDGAMLMNNEVSTAVSYQIPAVWIVLNDGLYNMCHQGSQMQGYKDMDVNIPQADFVMLARSMGGDGIRVERESDIQAALELAMASTKPFVVDVIIDSSRLAPIGTRISSLISQGAKN